MNKPNSRMIIFALWSLVISAIILGSFIFLIHSGKTVFAQQPPYLSEVNSQVTTQSIADTDTGVVEGVLLRKSMQKAEQAFILGASEEWLSAAIPQAFDALSPLSPPIPGDADLVVSMDSDSVWGFAGAGGMVTVTVDGTQMGAALADNNGFFWTTLYTSNGEKPDLDGGESIAIYHDGSLLASTTLHAVTAGIDANADDVTGNVSGVSSIDVTVYAGLDPATLGTYSQTVTTDGSGNFNIDLTGNWDFVADERARIVYKDNGIEVQQRVIAQRLFFMDFPFNQVGGNTTPGAVITVTLYESDGITVRQQEVGTASEDEVGDYRFTEIDMDQDDIVGVEIEGVGSITRTVDPLDLTIDADNDRFSGVTRAYADIACRYAMLTENGQVFLSLETTADATGVYTADLSSTADIMPGDWGGCYVHDDEGDDQVFWTPASGYIAVDQTSDAVYGMATPPGYLMPGGLVSMTLYSSGNDTISFFSKEKGWWGDYSFNPDEDGVPDIQPGDTITVESGIWQQIVDVVDINVAYDVVNDQFTGEVTLPSDRVELSGQYIDLLSSRDLYPVGGSFDTGVTANSPYTAGTSGFDVRNGVEYEVRHRTSDGMSNIIWRKTDNVRLWTQYNILSGVVFPPANTAYTITLLDNGSTVKAEITGESEGPVGDVGWLNFWDYEAQIQPGDYLEIRAANGLSQTLHVPDHISVSFDADADEIMGTGPENRLLFIDVGELGRGYVPTDENGDFLVKTYQLQQLDSNGDFQEGQNVMVCYLNHDGNQICYSFDWPDILIDVNYAHQWLEIMTLPEETVYITLTDGTGVDKATLSGESDGGGYFRTYEWQENWDPEPPVIQPGDRVTVTVADLLETVNPIGEVLGELNLDLDVVTGTLNAPWFSPLTLTVACEVWVENGPGFEIEGVEADGGEFICNFGDRGWDLQPEHDVALRYREPDGDSVINVVRSPWMRVNYGHDWAGGSYPAGHTFWITQTQEGEAKAFATLNSEIGGGWGGDGFETRDEDWSPARPDLESGDAILFTSDDGYTNTVVVGDITGFLDSGADYISGTVNAPWFSSQTLRLYCQVWSENGGEMEVEVEADHGLYECDFSGEVDILRGDTVAVMYVEPDDGDYVINTFMEPVPDVEVHKWNDGDAAAGGRLTYWIEYWNHGEAQAISTIITDTLPVSTTYIVDSSPFSVMTTVNEVIWDLGVLPAQSNGRFRMVIEIDPDATGSLDNHIEISTIDDNNPDNNHSDHSMELVPLDVDLAVDKWINQADPAPGYDFKYILNYYNQGLTGSGPVVLTDTLPVPTSYVDFIAWDPLWYLVSNDGVNVVFAHPGIPGNSGNQIELTLHLSDTIDIDDQITNTVEIATPQETGGSDNNTNEHVATVRDPHLNIGIDKQFAYGTTVAGHDVTFGLHYRNHSNVPAHHVFITDTLPAGTEFVTITKEIWNGYNWEHIPFTSFALVGNQIVFDMGTLHPATEGALFLTIHIDPSVVEGTILTNEVEIATLGPNDYEEGWFGDNTAFASVTVRDTGQNLMVIKHDRSSWEGDPPLTIRYDFQVYNVGTVPVNHLTLEDMYPDVTTFAHADVWWGGDIHFDNNDSQHTATWTITETLWPGDSLGGQVTVDLDPGENRGSIFTNTIEILPVDGDVYPEDNVDYEVLTTGPDLYVIKTAPSAWVNPGDLVTFTISFGNKARRGMDWTEASTRLTDTLPSGMTYITSTIMGCEGDHCPFITPDIQGDQLIFEIGQMGDGWSNEIYLTAKVDEGAVAGDTFGNHVAFYSDNPIQDPEGDYTNNTDEFTLSVLDPAFEVDKTYETTKIAGTLVTYTLHVTNTGNEDATGVMLVDTLPAGLTYGTGDGGYNAGNVLWNLGTIDAHNGTATGWFNATLPCTLVTITNESYAVTSSDQNVSSESGPPVSFVVVEPNIGATYEQSAVMVEPNTTVYFTATMTTDGPGFDSYAWSFEDLPQVFMGRYVNRTFTSEGVYTATFAVTDICGYTAGALTKVTVKWDYQYIFLPFVVRNK